MIKESKIILATPHEAQQKVIDEAQRFNVVCCGRRWGKTALGINHVILKSLAGKSVAWCSPSYKMLLEVWRELETKLSVISKVSQQQRRIELKTGGLIEMWSLDNPQAIRGRKYHSVIIDEAAVVRDLSDTWQSVIRPTLTDYEGEAWLLSTPRGRDFFWECFNRGQRDTLWKSWKMPTSTNPYIKDAEIELARLELPRSTFEQEYQAEFISSAEALFSEKDLDLAEKIAREDTSNGSEYLISVDVGRRKDATVINVFDLSVTPYQRVYHEYLISVPYPVIQERIEIIASHYRGTLLIESNGVGDPVIENLRVPASPFLMSRRTKTDAIQALQILLEQGRLGAKWTAQERMELLQYRWDDSRLTQDCVMSLAIAAYYLNNPLKEERILTERVSISSW